MSGRRLQLVHVAADDRGPESGTPNVGRSGQAVAGFASFYWPGSGWLKVHPGRLDLAELWGGGSGFGNYGDRIISGSTAQKPAGVEFYLDQATVNHPSRVRGYVALNGDRGEFFSFGFFGRRYS